MIKYLISLYKCLFIDSVAKPYFNFNRTRYGRNASLCHSENDGKCCFLKKGGPSQKRSNQRWQWGWSVKDYKATRARSSILTRCHQNTVQLAAMELLTQRPEGPKKNTNFVAALKEMRYFATPRPDPHFDQMSPEHCTVRLVSNQGASWHSVLRDQIVEFMNGHNNFKFRTLCPKSSARFWWMVTSNVIRNHVCPFKGVRPVSLLSDGLLKWHMWGRWYLRRDARYLMHK